MFKFDNLIDVVRWLVDMDIQSFKFFLNVFYLRCNYCYRVGYFVKKCYK